MPAKRNEIQRNNILISARKLFYEKGYKNAYFDNIAKECGISGPLISYYFSSKAELALEVHKQWSDELNNKASYKMYKKYYEGKVENYNFQVSTAVGIRLLYMMYLRDDKVARFTDERADDKYESFWPGNPDKYIAHHRRYHLNINPIKDEISMMTAAAPAAAYAVVRGYRDGKIHCTEEECLDYVVALNFKLMNISTERTNEILTQSKRLMKKIDFKIVPYFRVE